jgi:nucleotide-binding universal stress UspA family protein
MFETTVVGVDDRQGGRDALALAATLTTIEGGELLAVRAYPHEPRPSRAMVGGFDEDMRAGASSELDHAVAESGATARRIGVLATVCGAQARVLSAIATPVMATSPATYESDWLAGARQDCEVEVEQAISILEGMGVDASGDVVVGLAVDELAELSREVDLFVVGSRGWGPVRRLLLGSTSERLVREAACPVIAVPRPGGER